jgi:flagellar motor protein MotB
MTRAWQTGVAITLLQLALAPGAYAAQSVPDLSCRADESGAEACEGCKQQSAREPRTAACGHGERGAMLDESQTRVVEPAHNLETSTPDYAAPSASIAHEMQIMRETITTLPQRAPAHTETISDTLTGASFISGSARLAPAARARLDEIAQKLRGKANLRFAVTGYTDNVPLSAATQRAFADNRALSEARAFAVAKHLQAALGLPAATFTIRGEGENQPLGDNASDEGRARNRRTEISVWHDVVIESPPPAPVVTQGPPVEKLVAKPQCATASAAGTAPFRITVDGEPIDTTVANEADRQRCVDVGLERSDIQVRYDPMNVVPALNVTAFPAAVAVGDKVTFATYSNYALWIARAEVRVFEKGQSTQQTPLVVLPATANGTLEWAPPGPIGRELFYVLRVYDRSGRFDETGLKKFALTDRMRPLGDEQSKRRELLTGYGESSLRLRNIPVAGGSVTVNGKNIKPNQRVQALGIAVPVDAQGKFALRQIMPAGPHRVVVEVREPDGRGYTFERNLTIADRDWFYIAVADLTASRDSTTGPAQLVTGDTTHYNNSTAIDGRGAFYLKGKIKGEYLLTASADTQEQPLKNLFTNFASKDPQFLLRRIDPNLYYPVYGDDSTTLDDAPTQGKFYVRLEKGDSHVMWGNFQTRLTGTEFTQFNRGLYGAGTHWTSDATTSFGEKRSTFDGFAADPGTIQSREEFRGTGGSLYYLRNQDLTMGAERVWIEVRDKDSGIVIQTRQLIASQDYEMNYFQGRVLLREALSSVADGTGLVQTASLAGHPVYLVVTYEYVPGFTAISNVTAGGRASHWFNDHLRIGATAFRQGEAGAQQQLGGLDTTLRYKPGTYVKAEVARSDGPGTATLTSPTGGFTFNQIQSNGAAAGAQRIEAATDLSELAEFGLGGKGRANVYWQNRQNGFSGPGQIASLEGVMQRGGAFDVAVGAKTALVGKADERIAQSQSLQTGEVGLRQQLNPNWSATAGLRVDDRMTTIPNASPTLSQNGSRSDVVLRLDYKPVPAKDPAAQIGDKTGADAGSKNRDWDAYGFTQGTASKTGDRPDNSRIGFGGAYRINDRFKLGAEASDGYGGLGGKVLGDYRFDERRSMYVNYLSEADRTDTAYSGRASSWVTGSRYRFSDHGSVFSEDRITRGNGPAGLTHAYGLDLAPDDRWSYGLKLETGKLSDPLAGDFARRAVAGTVGYHEGKTKYAGNLEYRIENGPTDNRTTWLTRNSLGYQIDPAWRLLGKANLSVSNSTQGTQFNADYTEMVAAFAYRPVDNDRWNTLFKYTYFYNLPSPGQLASNGVAADYSQKSQILSIDTIYNVRPWVSVGVKYAMRYGELLPSKTDTDWLSSNADLMVLRTDFHWIREWDIVGELRRLAVRAAGDSQSGALVGVYRHIDDNIKVGVGYNFTNFAADLTDQSYRSHGFFLNMLSKF